MSRILSIAVLAALFSLTSCQNVSERSLMQSSKISLQHKAVDFGAEKRHEKAKPDLNLGLLLGTWADHEIHEALNDADRARNQQAERRVVNAPAGQMVTWNNADSGNSGTIVALRDAYDGDGLFCREIQQTVALKGRQKRGSGIACQQDDGEWKVQPRI